MLYTMIPLGLASLSGRAFWFERREEKYMITPTGATERREADVMYD